MNMKNCKILAMDLDGTLTNDAKEITDRNKQAIEAAVEKGIAVVLASGRPRIGQESVLSRLEMARLGGYSLCCNGAQIVSFESGKAQTLHSVSLDPETISRICNLGREHGVYALTYDEVGIVCENDTDESVQKEAYNCGLPIRVIENLEETIFQEHLPASKMVLAGAPARLQEICDVVKASVGEKGNVFFSEPWFLEVAPPGIEKAEALRWLCNKLGASMSEVIAFGDGMNDVSMLQAAGLGVAMGNAEPAVKACADMIAASNNEDGVAEFLYAHVL